MPLKIDAIVTSACLAITVTACSSPNTPSVTVVSGRPISPSNGATSSYYAQPITIVVASGLTTGGATPVTTVEVATDVAFTSIVTTQSVTASASGEGTISLDHLAPATTYYWRVKTTAGNNPGAVGPPNSFTISPLLVVQAPVPVQPIADSYQHNRPTFTVMNAAHTGPAATLTYQFEVATDPSFGTLVARGTVPEGATQTSFTPGSDLVPGTSYVWRAQASDTAKGVASAYSTLQTFTTVYPGDGSYLYTLTMQSPSWCLTHSTSSNGCGNNVPDWVKSDFSFDGTLFVDGDTLTFKHPATTKGFSTGPLTLQFQRSGTRLAGTVSGTADDTPPAAVDTVTVIGAVSGEADNRGQFGHTLNGTVTLYRGGFPCDHASFCSTSAFVWTLTPR